MNGALLATTTLEGRKLLGSPAQRSFELVTSAVESRLGPDHAAIFAEPFVSPDGTRTDWYAQLGGKALRLANLGAETREEVLARLDRYCAEIAAEGQRLEASAETDDQRLGEALSNAATYPGDEAVHVVQRADGTLAPVIVDWASLRDGHRNARGVLTGTTPAVAGRGAMPAPRDVQAVAVARDRGWDATWLLLLGWLILALMLAAIVTLTVRPCLLAPLGIGYCQGAQGLRGESVVIENQIAILKRELAAQNRDCTLAGAVTAK